MSAALAESLLYHNAAAQGFVSMMTEGSQQSFPLSELPAVMDGVPLGKDAYLSQAEFRRPNRRMVSLARIGLCFADCDTHKSDYGHLSPDAQARALMLYCDDEGIPKPSLINHSGRGLHAKWLYDAPLPADALPRWNAAQKALGDRFKPFAVDRGARDASRFLRIVGTVNSRNGETARTVWIEETNGKPNRWDFEELCREVLPKERTDLYAEKQAREAIRHAQNREGGYTWSPGHLWWLRLQDLQMLLRLRGWDGDEGVPVGYRHNVLFIGACAICWSQVASAWKAEIAELARHFCPTLPASQVRGLTESAVRSAQEQRDRRMSSQYIIDLLDIGADERQFLKTLLTDEERTVRRDEDNRRRHRKESARATYEANAQQRRETAARLRAEGYSLREVAERLDCTLNAVQSLLKQGGRHKDAPHS